MDTEEPPAFSDLLRRARLAAGLTQEELADRAGVSGRAISNLERGVNQAPHPDTLALLAEALGLSARERRQWQAARQRPRPATACPPRAPTPRHNLPLALTSLVGRTWELAEVRRLLATTRLVTRTGSGGVGKTRLALQVAADIADDGEAYPHGVWLVELAPLTDPEQVVPAVATVLGVREQPGQPLHSTVVVALATRQVLVVLDNCAHLLAAVAHLAEAVLRRCPGLRVLATSREALAVTGETTWRVASLALPGVRPLPPLAELAQVAAVRLFAEQAALVQPGFAVTVQAAAAVAELCVRLDGISLALELAAARVRALPVAQIAAPAG